jgi:predicted amidohydrolase YtcJ
MMVSRRTVLKAGALFAGLSILPATKTVAATRLQPAEPPPAAPADVIFWGGPIVPVGGPRREAAALAVRGQRIVAVGERHAVARFRGPATEVVDLRGRALLPGFVEPHLHLLPTAIARTFLDVSPFTIATFAAAKEKLSAAVGEASPGAWVVASGYDPSLMSDVAPDSQITVQDLDPIAPNNPVLIFNLSGHIAYVNTQAFEIAGITRETPDPPGGRFLRDANGDLTGVVEEVTALKPFVATLPQTSVDALLELALAVAQDAAAAGCTTLNDNGTGAFSPNGLDDAVLLQQLVSHPNAPVRMSAFPIGLLLHEWPFGPGAGDDMLRFTKIKFWADGSTQGYTAALKQPYLNSTSTGFLNYTPEELRAAVAEAIGLGWPVSIHCNGDAALEQALDVFEAILDPSVRSGQGARHRIEHCTVNEEAQLERMARLGLTPSFTIGHVYYWGRVFRDQILGPERAARIDPGASCVRLGMPFSLHSDAFTTPIEPLRYVQTAVTRRVRDGGDVLGAEQRVSVDEALKAVTLYPAWQLDLDPIVGSLEVGKYADLVILEQDPRMVDPDAISAIKVLETWLGGVRKYL